MTLYHRISDITKKLSWLKDQNKKIGFVPTMGALHKGHLSLIKASKEKTDITVCSVFVNPTQFNDPADFEKYPKTIENDILLLEQNKTDILFLPCVEEIYSQDWQKKQYDLGYLETLLEGKYRPGHFQGVCQVVHRLLEIIQPDELFLGQKDYQQCLVIKKLIELENLSVNENIVTTVRENTGLAMSSRNLRLSAQAKEKASGIYEALKEIRKDFRKKDIAALKQEAADKILANGFDRIDYVEIADAETLKPISNYNNSAKAVAFAAAHINGVRLIDNLIL